MSEEDRVAWEFLLALLVAFIAGISLMLAGLWFTTPPMSPMEFMKAWWGLYVGLLVCVCVAVVAWLYVRLREGSDE